MQLSLNLGTINIADEEVAKFIKSKSLDEIKTLFVTLLKNQILPHPIEDDLDQRLKNLKIVNPQKGERVRKALDSLNQKLEPLKNEDFSVAKESYFKEKFAL